MDGDGIDLVVDGDVCWWGRFESCVVGVICGGVGDGDN
jgi:hypothetical protein